MRIMLIALSLLAITAIALPLASQAGSPRTQMTMHVEK